MMFTLLFAAALVFAGSQQDKVTKAAGGLLTTANRAHAKPGPSITPKDFPSVIVAGLKEIGNEGGMIA